MVGARQEQLVEELLGAAEHGEGRLGRGAWRLVEAVGDEHVVGEVVLWRKGRREWCEWEWLYVLVLFTSTVH